MADKRQELEELRRIDELTRKAQGNSPFTSSPGGDPKTALQTGLEGVAKAADYAGGLTRTGAASLAGATKEGDWQKALHGEAPGTAQYLEQAGVPEGPKASDVLSMPYVPQQMNPYGEKGSGAFMEKGGAADPSLRSAAGFIGDTALDPLTYASAGLSSAKEAGTLGKVGEVLNKAVNPIESYNRNASPKLFQKAFKKIDDVAVKEGKPKISEVLRQNGFTGSMQDAVEAAGHINQKAGQEIGSILQEATNRGVKVDLTKAFDGVMQEASDLRKIPESSAHDLAEKIDSKVMDILTRSGGQVTPTEANQLKGHLANMLGERGFNSDHVEKIIDKAVIGDLTRGVKGSVNAADEELLKRLELANRDYAATSSHMRDKLQSIAQQPQYSRGAMPTAVDLMLAGGATVSPASLGALALKKTGEAAMSTTGRTTRGQLAKKIGENASGALDVAARRAALSPWVNSKKEERK